VLLPKAKTRVCELEFLADSKDLHFRTQLTFETNTSLQHMPVHVYQGRLNCSLPDLSLRLGALVLNAKVPATRSFNLTNDNPIPITLESWHTSSLPGVALSVTHIHRGPAQKEPLTRESSPSKGPDLVLQPQEVAEVLLTVTGDKEGEIKGELHFATLSAAFGRHTLKVKVDFLLLDGQVFVEPVAFQKSFPGVSLRLPVTARSSFKRKLQILSMVSSEPQFATTLSDPTLLPKQNKVIGHIEFIPGLIHPDRNPMQHLPVGFNKVSDAHPNRLSPNGK